MEEALDFPPYHFRCPISMELMKVPVTISTGVTYERVNIEKWFFVHKKKTCPATMQKIENFDVIPNHTLERVILAWQNQEDERKSTSTEELSSSDSDRHEEIKALLGTIMSSPFKVSSLKKLRSIVEMREEMRNDFVRSNGVEVLVQILDQILTENSDFVTFRACEEALCILHQLPISEEEDDSFKLLSRQDSTRSLAIMLQRGSAEARLHTITIFKKMSKTNYDWNFVIQDQGMDFFKSILELVSDEICSKASSFALEVLIEILRGSKKHKLRAIEAGAICVLIELLPESSRSRCEKMMQVIKLLCECVEGRLALVEHGMGMVVISKKMLHVSNVATKIGVKIVWLVCNFHPTEKVLEEMLMYGTVKKLLALLHMDGRSSTKDKVVKMFKMHGNSWKRYPCYPNCDLKGYLGCVNDLC